MPPEDAADAVREIAIDFGHEQASAIETWTAFHEHLFDMCAEVPLSAAPASSTPVMPERVIPDR
jgi:hypothetical protein